MNHVILGLGCLVVTACVVYKAPEPREILNYKESIVLVQARFDQRIGIGSGVIIGCVKNPYGSFEVTVLTAQHVVDESPNEIWIFSGEDSYQATMAIHHQFMDATLLLVNSQRAYPVIPLREGKPKELEPIRAYSYPIGVLLSVTQGITNFKASNKIESLENDWSANVHIYPGSSGGAIVSSEDNKLIDIITACLSEQSSGVVRLIPDVSFFLPIDSLYGWIKENSYV
jgi:S1-C subfamily serine protease